MTVYTTHTAPTQYPVITLVDSQGNVIDPISSLSDQTVNGSLTANSFRVGNDQVVGARGAAVANATGGSTVDTEARAALNALLARLRTHGLIAP